MIRTQTKGWFESKARDDTEGLRTIRVGQD